MIGNIIGSAAALVPFIIGMLGWARSVDRRLTKVQTDNIWIKSALKRLLASRGIPDILPAGVK